MRILFSASECAPFAKAGGLGDVVGALPKALHALGHDVRIIIPRYGFITTRIAKKHDRPLAVPLGDGEAWCGVYETVLPGSDVPLYFLEHNELYGGNHIYNGYGSTMHELARFGLLSRGTLQLCRHLDWIPDIIHVHDWPTAFVPLMLNTVERGDPFRNTASVMTIHNLAHQPRFPREGLDVLQVGHDVFRSDGIEDFGQLNPFKGGCYHSTMLTTVSPRYAQEIRTAEGGSGLHMVMDFRGADLVGILNGIDLETWNPETDPFLPANYSAEDLSGKAIDKVLLQRELGLQERPEAPLFGVVSRLTSQKGIDLIIEGLEEILALDVQVVILGSGDGPLETYLSHRSHWGGGRFCAWIGHNEAMAHRIEGGCDFFLMPSRFEPCGLNQMYSQRYGTLPIVRSTGGLDDTVDQCDLESGQGTGFKFGPLSPSALVDCIRWAVTVYRNHPRLIRRMQERSMTKQFGWDIPAQQYVDVYGWALSRVG